MAYKRKCTHRNQKPQKRSDNGFKKGILGHLLARQIARAAVDKPAGAVAYEKLSESAHGITVLSPC